MNGFEKKIREDRRKNWKKEIAQEFRIKPEALNSIISEFHRLWVNPREEKIPITTLTVIIERIRYYESI